MSNTSKAIYLVNGVVHLLDKPGKPEVFKFERAIAVGDTHGEILRTLQVSNCLFGRQKDRLLNRVKEAEKTGKIRLASVELVKRLGVTSRPVAGNPA